VRRFPGSRERIEEFENFNKSSNFLVFSVVMVHSIWLLVGGEREVYFLFFLFFILFLGRGES